jgi:hypothetical protein
LLAVERSNRQERRLGPKAQLGGTVICFGDRDPAFDLTADGRAGQPRS